jgi:hypothetical protein
VAYSIFRILGLIGQYHPSLAARLPPQTPDQPSPWSEFPARAEIKNCCLVPVASRETLCLIDGLHKFSRRGCFRRSGAETDLVAFPRKGGFSRRTSFAPASRRTAYSPPGTTLLSACFIAQPFACGCQVQREVPVVGNYWLRFVSSVYAPSRGLFAAPSFNSCVTVTENQAF